MPVGEPESADYTHADRHYARRRNNCGLGHHVLPCGCALNLMGRGQPEAKDPLQNCQKAHLADRLSTGCCSLCRGGLAVGESGSADLKRRNEERLRETNRWGPDVQRPRWPAFARGRREAELASAVVDYYLLYTHLIRNQPLPHTLSAPSRNLSLFSCAENSPAAADLGVGGSNRRTTRPSLRRRRRLRQL